MSNYGTKKYLKSWVSLFEICSYAYLNELIILKDLMYLESHLFTTFE